MTRLVLVLLVGVISSRAAFADHEVVPIWPGEAQRSEKWHYPEVEFYERPLPSSPRLKMIRNVIQPTLTVFLPNLARRTGTSVIICPGGGLRILDWVNEGTRVAEWLAQRGITAFVLKYRLAHTPDDPTEFQEAGAAPSAQILSQGMSARKHAPKTFDDIFAGDSAAKAVYPLARADAKQAVKLVREKAAQWGIKPNRIGLMGFSAGGFVVTGVVKDHEPESRPDFVAAIYGGETGVRPVPPDAPPLFALVAQDDEVGMAGVTVDLYSEWSAIKAPAELHIFTSGKHGFSTVKQGLPVDGWLKLFERWLTSMQVPTSFATRNR